MTQSISASILVDATPRSGAEVSPVQTVGSMASLHAIVVAVVAAATHDPSREIGRAGVCGKSMDSSLVPEGGSDTDSTTDADISSHEVSGESSSDCSESDSELDGSSWRSLGNRLSHRLRRLSKDPDVDVEAWRRVGATIRSPLACAGLDGTDVEGWRDVGERLARTCEGAGRGSGVHVCEWRRLGTRVAHQLRQEAQSRALQEVDPNAAVDVEAWHRAGVQALMALEDTGSALDVDVDGWRSVGARVAGTLDA